MRYSIPAKTAGIFLSLIKIEDVIYLFRSIKGYKMNRRNHLRSLALFVVAVSFLGVLISFTVHPPALARTVKAKIKVVNISYFDMGANITDADLIRLSIEEVCRNEKLFPKIEDLTLKMEGGKFTYSPGIEIPAAPLSFSGVLKPEVRAEYTSIAASGRAGKYDIAVVGSDGSIRKYDREVVINKIDKTIKTYQSIDIHGGDVVLLFIRNIKVVHFKNIEPEGHDQTPG